MDKYEAYGNTCVCTYVRMICTVRHSTLSLLLHPPSSSPSPSLSLTFTFPLPHLHPPSSSPSPFHFLTFTLPLPHLHPPLPFTLPNPSTLSISPTFSLPYKCSLPSLRDVTPVSVTTTPLGHRTTTLTLLTSLWLQMYRGGWLWGCPLTGSW